jgi:hypothetical protein
MSQMKELAQWLATSVYLYHMTDKDIQQAFENYFGKWVVTPDPNWIKGQIQTVRNNPEMYRDMA